MRSQLRFVMHSKDETAFAAQLLSDESVYLIDGPRWKTATPQTFCSLEEVAGSYCIVWSRQDCATLGARYIPACDDWYCEAESATIQFLRSQTVGSVVTEGRIAVSTLEAGNGEATGIERRFKGLVRYVKKHYTNSVVRWSNPPLPFAPAGLGRSANPSKPDSQVWVGPNAMQWLQQDQYRCVKQFIHSLVEGRLVEAAG